MGLTRFITTMRLGTGGAVDAQAISPVCAGLPVPTPVPVSTFRAAWWLPSAHLQTLWPALVKRRSRIALRRERLELPDGDFLDLDWTPRETGPIVVILHGLEGSSDSHYAGRLLETVHDGGWRGVVMHFRGCSGEPNRLPRTYHSGETGDVQQFVRRLRQAEPDTAIAVVGYSLGGNVLLKWLGETGEAALIACAVAVSVPFDLADCARRLERGLSRLYQWWLLKSLRASILRKFGNRSAPIELTDLDQVRTFREFDDRVTAPLHGFAGVDDYYARSSSRKYLAGIRVPTLVLHARDDPFMTPSAVPAPDEVSSSVALEVMEKGGHVGFVTGRHPWRARYWLEERIPRFLERHLVRPGLDGARPASPQGDPAPGILAQ
jgi:predicted alpha/beta-fold hydrolase